MRKQTIIAALSMVAFVLGLGGGASAGAGAFEINQACAADDPAAGCFAGDGPGFPVEIVNPGSYILTGNLVVPGKDTTAIFVDASYVTLDLNGFRLEGPVSCLGAGSGISCLPVGTGRGIDVDPPSRRVHVRNGMIFGFADDGAYVENEARLEHVTATGNGGDGIDAGGFSVVVHCIAQQNGQDGIAISSGSASQNTSSWNGRFGVFSGAGTTFTNNQIFENGDIGMRVGDANVVIGNTVVGNEKAGIQTFGRTNILDNAVVGNLEHQIEAYNGSKVSRNTVFGDTAGFFGLRLGADVAYNSNVITTGGTHGTVNGGKDTGGNLCDGASCP